MSSKSGRKTKYLWVYSAGDDWTVAWHEKMIERRRERGYDVIGFCNTPRSLKRRWMPFPELDRHWKMGDPALLSMYESLLDSASERDVLILYNGANLHPEFVRMLSILKVYTAGDDPESTEILTKPIAPAFDIHLINNIACIDMYRSWGLQNVFFWPIGSISTIDDVRDLNEENILDLGRREYPIIFLGGFSPHRKERLNNLIKKFPQAFVGGSGMPQGFISWDEMWNIYRKTQIGWNVHNSSGPINFRTYELPAYGVMQICDNKSNLGKIFELDKEVVGFDSIDECIEKTQYYLDNPEEQREIALAGWKRWKKDYHPDRVWELLTNFTDRSSSRDQTNNEKKDIEVVRAVLREKRSSGYFLVDIHDTMTLAMKRIFDKIS